MNDPEPLTHPDNRPGWSTRAILPLLLILGYAIGVRLATLDAPFHRTSEGISSFYGVLARNYFRHDLSNTFGVPVQSIGVHTNVKPVFYDHHPPLVPMFIAAVYGLTDDPFQPSFIPAEWKTRLPAAFFTLGCIVAIYAMVRSRAGPRTAFLAAGTFAAMPITILFGGAADVINSQLVFFVMLTLAAYLRFHKRTSAKNLMLLAAAFIGAGWTDWPAYFIVPVLLVHFAFTRPVKQWPWIICFCGIAGIIFAVAYVQIVMVNHDWLWMIDLVKRRSVESSLDRNETFTWMEWVRDGLWQHNLNLHTLPILVLAAAYVMGFLGRISPSSRVRGTDEVATLLRLLLAWAALHIFIGRQGVFQHPWWWWPLTPGLALAAAMMLESFCTWAEHRETARWQSSTLAILLLAAFAGWTTPRTLQRFDADTHPIPVAIVGQTIRQIVPSGTSVLLADDDIDSPALWYYSDRPIVLNIWTADAVYRAIEHPEKATLVWSATERWPFPPGAYLYPKMYLERTGGTAMNELRQRFDVTETGEFWIVDLHGKWNIGIVPYK